MNSQNLILIGLTFAFALPAHADLDAAARVIHTVIPEKAMPLIRNLRVNLSYARYVVQEAIHDPRLQEGEKKRRITVWTDLADVQIQNIRNYPGTALDKIELAPVAFFLQSELDKAKDEIRDGKYAKLATDLQAYHARLVELSQQQ